MSARDTLTVLSGLAVLLASTALFPVFDSAAWVVRTATGVAVVVGTLLLARLVRVPAALQSGLALLVLLGYAVLAFAAGTLHHLVLPGADTVEAMQTLVEAARADVERFAPPVPVGDGTALVTVLAVGAVAVLVDAVAVLARRPAAAGLPLLVLFAVPSAIVSGRLGWWPFVLAAGGWLALLLVEGRERVGRWGAPLRAGGGAALGDPAGVGRVGRRLGAAALGIAVVVPVLVPGLDTDLLGGGTGDGEGDGPRNVQTYNPLTRLRGQLVQPDPTPVLSYATTDPVPDYLRMTTLGEYDGDGWRAGELRGTIDRDGVKDRALGSPVGEELATTTRQVVARITVEALDAFWLPMPFPPSTVEVEGPWMWDPVSQSVFAVRATTVDIEPYTVRVNRVLPDAALLDRPDAGPLPSPVEPYAAPIDVTPTVRALTEDVIAGADSDYARAAAIQSFFTDPGEGFVYDLQTSTGGSPDALEDFLAQRRGFCEQYASAMAAMLRVAGVPSRVAVGFTPGTRQADGRRLVTTDEAHAWPEGWFEGAGWVRFEPTPALGGITPPDYSSADAAGGGVQPERQATGPVPDLGAADPAESPLERRERLEAEAAARLAEAERAAAADSGGPPVGILAGVAGLLVLLAAPAGLHALRRRRRWAHLSALTAWEQLRDDAVDVGHRWSDAESPRVAGARLRQERALGTEGRAALGRLVLALERARYARPAAPIPAVPVPAGLVGAGQVAVDGGEPAGLTADVAAVRTALLDSSPRGVRWRARVLPPSTLSWVSHTAGATSADALDAVDRATSRVGLTIRQGAGRLLRRPAPAPARPGPVGADDEARSAAGPLVHH